MHSGIAVDDFKSLVWLFIEFEKSVPLFSSNEKDGKYLCHGVGISWGHMIKTL